MTVGLTGGTRGVRLPGGVGPFAFLLCRVDAVSGLRLTRAISRGLAFPTPTWRLTLTVVRDVLAQVLGHRRPTTRTRATSTAATATATESRRRTERDGWRGTGRQRSPNRRTDRDRHT